jgi:hypothetical protein
VCLEHDGVPLVLESAEQRGYRREVWRARGDDLRRLELDQVLDSELFAGDGIRVVFGDVGLDQALFKDIATASRGASPEIAQSMLLCVVDSLRRVVLQPSATFLRKARRR